MKIKFLLLDIHIFKYYFYKQYCLNGLKISFNFYYHSLLKVEERLRYKFSFFKFQLSFVVRSVNSTFFENLEFVPIDWSRAKVRSENLGTDISIYIYIYIRKIVKGFGFFIPSGRYRNENGVFHGLDPRYDYAPLLPPRPGRVT